MNEILDWQVGAPSSQTGQRLAIGLLGTEQEDALCALLH